MKTEPWKANIVERQILTPNMQRLILEGDSLAEFPEGFIGGYVKLLFEGDEGKPVTRSYTVRDFEPETRRMALDYVLHADGGPAATWLETASVGEEISFRGPGPVKLSTLPSDWYLIAGDMTALPAIAVNLASLPEDAVGYAVIEVIEEDDQVDDLIIPEGMELIWIINPNAQGDKSLLIDRIQSLPWLDGTPSIWFASEFSGMRALRPYFEKEKGIDKERYYISSYWKSGDTDEGNKIAKFMLNEELGKVG